MTRDRNDDHETRLRADVEIVRRLVADEGCELWPPVRERLAEYAVPVVTAWVRSDTFAARAAPARRGDDVEGLVHAVVRRALADFDDRRLAAWRPGRRTSLATYFLRTCLGLSPDEGVGSSGEAREVGAGDAGTGLDAEPGVPIDEWLGQLFDLDPRLDCIATMRLQGATRSAIARHLDTSVADLRAAFTRARPALGAASYRG